MANVSDLDGKLATIERMAPGLRRAGVVKVEITDCSVKFSLGTEVIITSPATEPEEDEETHPEGSTEGALKRLQADFYGKRGE
jgi:hypothetical protein